MGRIAGVLAGLVLVACAMAMPAQAANTRVSITDFKWSKMPTVDLNESVTWDWLGPDTMHSITGQAPNATQWDSDPGTSMPLHFPGSTYKVTFDQPGEYLFVCKLHSSVRGTVTVTDQPGDPDSDPGPQPAINFDVVPPTVSEVAIQDPVMGPKGRGTVLKAAIDERGVADADYYKLVKVGKKGKKRTVRKFMGYTRWEVFIGYNELHFAAKSPTFRNPSPGKYEALFRVTDLSHNMTEPTRVTFEIKKAKKKKKGKKRRR